MSTTSQKVAIALGVGAATGLALWFLNKKENGASAAKKVAPKKQLDPKDVTKADVVQILEAILSSQAEMKEILSGITDEVIKDGIYNDFSKIYERVVKMQPDDPLSQRGLSTLAFDQLLDQYASEKEVQHAISRVMGGAVTITSENATATAKNMTVAKIVDVHVEMLKELQAITKNTLQSTDSKNLDHKTVTIAAQVIVGCKIQLNHKITSEDLEQAVFLNHNALSVNAKFNQINNDLQRCFNEIIMHMGNN